MSPPPSGRKIQSLHDLKSLNQELYITQFRFKKLMLVDTTFNSQIEQFNPYNLLEDIKAQNNNPDRLTTFLIPDQLPERIIGDRNWFEYIVKRLINNGHERTK